MYILFWLFFLYSASRVVSAEDNEFFFILSIPICSCSYVDSNRATCFSLFNSIWTVSTL